MWLGVGTACPKCTQLICMWQVMVAQATWQLGNMAVEDCSHFQVFPAYLRRELGGTQQMIPGVRLMC